MSAALPPNPLQSHSFIVRVRVEDVAVGHLIPDYVGVACTGQSPLRIRLEYVDNDIGQATTIPEALAWLEARMRRLLPPQHPPFPPIDRP